MLNLNRHAMQQVAAQASEKLNATIKSESTAKRWRNAIIRALVEFEMQPEFMTYDPEGDALLIWSQKSNEIYSANGVCQCKAYMNGFPCWHRAAQRLVKIYNESAH